MDREAQHSSNSSNSDRQTENTPRYAIVRLNDGDDVFKLFKVLLEHGYSDVSFVQKDSVLPWALDNKIESNQTDLFPNKNSSASTESNSSGQEETDSNSDSDSNLGLNRSSGSCDESSTSIDNQQTTDQSELTTPRSGSAFATSSAEVSIIAAEVPVIVTSPCTSTEGSIRATLPLVPHMFQSSSLTPLTTTASPVLPTTTTEYKNPFSQSYDPSHSSYYSMSSMTKPGYSFSSLLLPAKPYAPSPVQDGQLSRDSITPPYNMNNKWTNRSIPQPPPLHHPNNLKPTLPLSMLGTPTSLQQGYVSGMGQVPLVGQQPPPSLLQPHVTGASLLSPSFFHSFNPPTSSLGTLGSMTGLLTRRGPEGLPPYTTPATTQLRQRGSRTQCDDPNVFVACRLCQNKIMASRLSNLTNHVRRHSTLKQFQCCYCDYTHNEMAKVRLHMLHNHKDKDSQPIDNLSPEMQTAWDILMQQCFPDHYQGSQSSHKSALATALEKTKPTSQMSNNELFQTGNYFLGRGSVPCADCGQIVSMKDRLNHIHRVHLNCCPHVCSVCGFEHESQEKVLLHITLKHPSIRSAQVFTRDILTIAEALLPKYFPPHLFKIATADDDPQEKTKLLPNPGESPASQTHNSPVTALVPPDVPTLTNGPSLSTPPAPHVATPFSEAGMPIEPPVLAPVSQSHLLSSVQSILSGMRSFSNGGNLEYGGLQHNSNFGDQCGNMKGLAENLRCQLCRKVLDGIRPLSSLLNHAKRHYHLKQFQCVQCPYSSSEAAHVRSHMKLKHYIRGRSPLDNRSPSLQVAWMQTMVRCFPSVAPRLKKFRFKNFRNKPSGRPRTREDSPSLELPDEEESTTEEQVEGPNVYSGSSSPGFKSPCDPAIEICQRIQMDMEKERQERYSQDGVDPKQPEEELVVDDCEMKEESEPVKSEENSPAVEGKEEPTESACSGGNSGENSPKQTVDSDSPRTILKCHLCGMSCSGREEQMQHISHHVPLKPFRCSVCQYRTTDYQQLRAHLWKHKLIGGDRQKATLKAGIDENAEVRSQYVKYCFGDV